MTTAQDNRKLDHSKPLYPLFQIDARIDLTAESLKHPKSNMGGEKQVHFPSSKKSKKRCSHSETDFLQRT